MKDLKDNLSNTTGILPAWMTDPGISSRVS